MAIVCKPVNFIVRYRWWKWNLYTKPQVWRLKLIYGNLWGLYLWRIWWEKLVICMNLIYVQSSSSTNDCITVESVSVSCRWLVRCVGCTSGVVPEKRRRLQKHWVPVYPHDRVPIRLLRSGSHVCTLFPAVCCLVLVNGSWLTSVTCFYKGYLKNLSIRHVLPYVDVFLASREKRLVLKNTYRYHNDHKRGSCCKVEKGWRRSSETSSKNATKLYFFISSTDTTYCWISTLDIHIPQP